MHALLLALLMSANPPPADQASKLASKGEWEELYLAWSSVDPTGYPEAERHAIASALQKGCLKLAGSDKVMAYSLGERAVAYEETADALHCVARTSLATEQRGSAEEALRRGLERFPKDGRFGLTLGQMLLEDKDPEGALAVLGRVPAHTPEAAKVKALQQKARREADAEKTARAQAEALERRMEGGDTGRPSPRGRAAAQPESPATSGLSYTSGVSEDGMRTRANARFVVKYFNNNRDFGQRSEYEGRIVAALEEAYTHTRSVLGEARQAPVDAVLYTREEFRTHHGASLAQMVAGLYSDGAIRINNAAELTRNTKGTLTHEYVHAVVDELCGFHTERVPKWFNEGLAKYIQWRYLGADGPPPAEAALLRQAAASGQLPSLSTLAQGALIYQGDPVITYGTSALAVKELMRRGGSAQILALLRRVGEGEDFDTTMTALFDRDMAKLDADVLGALSRR